MQPESLRVSNSGSYATLDVLCTRERNDDHQRRLEILVAQLEQTKKRREEVMKMLRDFGSSLAVTSSTSQKNMFKFGNNHHLQNTNIQLVRKLLRDLRRAGVKGPDDL